MTNNNPMKILEVASKHGRTMKKLHEDPNSKYNSKEYRENLRQYMLNGGAVHANSFITDDSKLENNLFVLSCKVLPRPIHKFSIYRGKKKRNYTVDIGDSSLGILLEFDGYYHFNTKKAIAYHKKRQQEIEEDGWKFLRYNIFQKFPTIEQLKEDIFSLLS
jgi:very-short-patch-repair endonuclease